MAVNSSWAQSYYNAPNDTLTGNAVFNDVSVFNIIQVHPAPDTLYFKWHKQSVVMPSTWEASICDNGNCYTSLQDSGMMAPIVPGDDGLMSLHLDPKSEAGTGVIRYSLFAANTPYPVDTLTWIITAGTPTNIPEAERDRPQIFSSGHQVICSRLGGRYTAVRLLDMNGKQLYQQPVSGNEAKIDMRAYGNQVLILRLSGKRNFITKILNQ